MGRLFFMCYLVNKIDNSNNQYTKLNNIRVTNHGHPSFPMIGGHKTLWGGQPPTAYDNTFA